MLRLAAAYAATPARLWTFDRRQMHRRLRSAGVGSGPPCPIRRVALCLQNGERDVGDVGSP